MALEDGEVPNWIVPYFDAVVARAPLAFPVERRAAVFLDGTAPGRNECHWNAERFAKENPGHSVVRGWLVDTFNGESGLFVAHSILADTGGGFFDITPMPARSEPRFLHHDGSEEQFQALRVTYAQVPWPPLRLSPEPTHLAELEALNLDTDGFSASYW